MLVEFSMFPLDKGESVGGYVARSLEIIDASGLNYRLNPMGTVMEGSWEETFGVIKECFDRMSADCQRVHISIKVDYRQSANGQLDAKIEGVEKRIGKKLKS